MDDRYKSDIPADAIETSISEYKQEGGAIWPEKRKCTVDGVVVGYRYYEHDGSICIETPIKNGKKHGIEYSWECREDGPVLSLSEPYENGLIHGTAKQWAFDGSLLGTYTLYHGTGYDIWRGVDETGKISIGEIHSFKNGRPHGYEWWLNDDLSLYSETQRKDGQRHGVERHWDVDGKLEPGCPKFYIDNAEVSKSTYLARQKEDPDLPEYAKADDKNVRKFPDDVIAAIKSG